MSTHESLLKATLFDTVSEFNAHVNKFDIIRKFAFLGQINIQAERDIEGICRG